MPATGSVFAQWSGTGPCFGSRPTISFPIDADVTCRAYFAILQVELVAPTPVLGESQVENPVPTDAAAPLYLRQNVSYRTAIKLRNIGHQSVSGIVVRAGLSIVSGSATCAMEPLRIEYWDEEQQEWLHLPLRCDPDFSAFGRWLFGPQQGFPAPEGYDETTQLRVTPQVEGWYGVDVSAIKADAADQQPPPPDSVLSNHLGLGVNVVPPPAAPAWLVALPGDRQVVLAWDEVGPGHLGPITYNVYRLQDGQPVRVNDEELFLPRFLLQGLTNGQQYCFQITAKEADVESPPSREDCVVPTDGTDKPLRLELVPPQRVGPDDVLREPRRTSVGFLVTADLPYRTAVRLRNVGQETIQGVIVRAHILKWSLPASCAPEARIDIEYWDGSRWQLLPASGCEDGVWSYLYGPPATGFTVDPGYEQTTELRITARIDQNLLSDYFFFDIAAIAPAGSDAPQDHSGHIQDDLLVFSGPLPPEQVSATPGDRRVIVDWSLVEGATSYDLLVAHGGSIVDCKQGTVRCETLSSVQPPVTVTELQNGTQYCFAVWARNESGIGPLSQEVCAVPVAPPPPPPPAPPEETVPSPTGTGNVVFRVADGAVPASFDVTPVWPPPASPPAGYELPHGLYAATLRGLPTGSCVTIRVLLPSPVPTGAVWLKLQGDRWITVPIGSDDGDAEVTITLCDSGQGDGDGVADGNIIDPGGPAVPVPQQQPPPPPSAPPAAPLAVSLWPCGQGTACISFQLPEGATRYRLESALNPEFSFGLNVVEVPAQELLWGNTIPVGMPTGELWSFYYRLSACNAAGCSQPVYVGGMQARRWPGGTAQHSSFVVGAYRYLGTAFAWAQSQVSVPGKESLFRFYDGVQGYGGVQVDICGPVGPGASCSRHWPSAGEWVSAAQDFPPFGQVGGAVRLR
jgi:hypothetical protein